MRSEGCRRCSQLRDSISQRVKLAADTTEAIISTGVKFNQLIRIEAKSESTDYMLIVDSGGISLYNMKTSTSEKHINWP